MTTDTRRVSLPTNGRTRGPAANARHVFAHFLEMQIPMALGALVCLLAVSLISTSSSLAAVYHSGTFLFSLGDIFFLTVPVVAWRILRGHGRRASLEMAVAMVAPVAAIMVLGHLAGYPYLQWLLLAGYPAMCLGMLGYMLFRPGWPSGEPRLEAGRPLAR